MKKNLMSIIILALLVVNIVLTSVMMFSVTGVSKRTSALVGDIASVLNLELTTPSAEGGEAAQEVAVVPMEDIKMHSIPDEMMVNLKNSEDGKPHFALVSISFYMNTKDKEYKKYGETMSEKDPILKDVVNNVFGKYSVEDVRNKDTVDVIKKEILESVQVKFESEFIFDVAFEKITPQ